MTKWTNEQLEAINKEGTNIIVSAGAGSGKTAVLTQRVLRKLKSGVGINELLILTFTKAAATEMKERIRKNIKKEPSLISELDKIDSADITTFDSFALSIVRRYHYLLGISSNVSIVEQSLIDLKKREIINEIFEEYYNDNNDLFCKLINDFCTKDDKNIVDSILSINDKLDLKYDKEIYLKNYINNTYNNSKINNDIELYITLIKENIANIQNELKNLEEFVNSDYIIKLLDILTPLFNSNNYDEIKKNINIKLPPIPRGTEDGGKKIKENISNYLKNITMMFEYNSIQDIFNDINFTKDYVSVIIDIILKFDEKINKYKFDNDLYEFVDIAKMAIKVLSENENVRNELKYSLNEILVDEYQDTSDLQEQFLNLIENNNLYMVGDIKQSIYRFRNANPYIFKNKYDNYKENNGGVKIDLNKNFRSREEPLNNINEIFDLVMDNKIGGAEYKESHRMIYGNLAYNEQGKTNQNNNVEIYEYPFDKNSKFKKEEYEIFIIANDIKHKIDNHYQVFDKDELILRDIKYSDFVILMDRTSNFDLYKKIFEYLSIPLIIHKDENIANNINLLIIKNILTLIIKYKNKVIDEEFKYAFMSIARSYLFRYSDSDIFDYIVANNFYDSSIIKLIKEIVETIDSNSNINILWEIIDKFDFYNKIIEIGNVNETIILLDYILELSDNLADMNYDIYSFSKYLNEICSLKNDIKFSLNKEAGDAVNIMTIHKSKGLEYHVCYFPGLYAKFNISDLKEQFMFDNKFGFIIPSTINGIHDTIYKTLLKDKYIKDEISEKIRLFYVALTRVKEKIIIIRPLSETSQDIENNLVKDSVRYSYMSFDNIISSVMDKLDKYVKIIDIDKIGITKDYNLIKKYDLKNNINKSNELLKINEINIERDDIDKESFSKLSYNIFNREEKKNINYGKKVHKALEYLDFNKPNLDNIDLCIREKIKKFLDLDLLKNKIINSYHEYEFMYEKENKLYHGIIDLILETDLDLNIIDFKLKNINDLAYKKQLLGYKEYLKTISSKKINVYLYSILDGTLLCID